MNHHDHSHTHNHSHSHGHDHDHTHGKKELSFDEKIKSLFQHWIDHNESHKTSYGSWAKKAEDKRLSNIVDCLNQVSSLTDEINDKLKKALNDLT